MKALTVIPVIDYEFTKGCIESILAENSAAGIDAEDLLIVDNTREGLPQDFYGLNVYRDPAGHNLGVARAWNVGAKVMLDKKNENGELKYDYLTLMSASMFFGPMKETTWTRQMETFSGANCIESDGHSWHLIAFHRRVFELVGLFDSNFYPGYFEAIDFGYRLRMLNMEGGWPRVWVNAISRSVARHAELCPAPPLLAYYRNKWGGDKGEEKYVLPFGDRPLGFFEDEPIPDLARKYGLKVWW